MSSQEYFNLATVLVLEVQVIPSKLLYTNHTVKVHIGTRRAALFLILRSQSNNRHTFTMFLLKSSIERTTRLLIVFLSSRALVYINFA
jgi:hypothetical protein